MNLHEALYYHLVLPAMVPGSQPNNLVEIEQALISRLLSACNFMSSRAEIGALGSVEASLKACQILNRGKLESFSLISELESFATERKVLILHVVQQNAAVLIRRAQSKGPTDTVIFEVFEASPSCEAVLAAKNALLWDFPGHAVQVPMAKVRDRSFQENFASFLEQASIESLSRFAARSVKANASVIETRDTANCALVSQLLFTWLEAIGSPVKELVRFRKRVRDDVSFDNAELPWRRSPMWLILRVAVRRQLCLELGNEAGRACYKFLICIVLASFLEDCTAKLPATMLMTLRAKLCRRLAKLETDKPKDTQPAQRIYDEAFDVFSPWFKTVIANSTHSVELAWEEYKKSTLRPIPRLPLRADDTSFKLSLSNSRHYLQRILELRPYQRNNTTSISTPNVQIEQANKFANRYLDLTGLEQEIEAEDQSPPPQVTHCKQRCLLLSAKILHYITSVADAYKDNPQETSIFILNLLELWVVMDKCAIKACSLLADYAPLFMRESLDVLQLPRLCDMSRLHRIESYLTERHGNAIYSSDQMFSRLDQYSFPCRYVQNSEDRHRFAELRAQIKRESERSRLQKTSAYARAFEDYERFKMKMHESGPCLCRYTPDGERYIKDCTRCFYSRKMSRIVVHVHEEFLPADPHAADAVIFELGIPDYLSVYRDATWRMRIVLGEGTAPADERSKPKDSLPQYSQLNQFLTQSANSSSVTLASQPKSFLLTHYKGFKVSNSPELSDIILPLALEFQYYDTQSEVWLKDFSSPLTFKHSCGLSIPRGLESLKNAAPLELTPRLAKNPTSYEATASQSKCPQNMPVHEFLSYHKLISGGTQRWLDMLMELGSSSLNFSSEDATRLLAEISGQTGTMVQEDNVRRDAHFVLQDDLFCGRLVEQIERRLKSINWRETHCMDMLISLCLRLYELTSRSKVRHEALRLLKQARQITLRWVNDLRQEVRMATQADAAEKAAEYGRWAAVLCRKTFELYLGQDKNSRMAVSDVCAFIEASIGLQEHLIVDLEKLPPNFKSILISSLKMAHRLQDIISTSINSQPDCIYNVLGKMLKGSNETIQITYSEPQLLPSPYVRWLVVVATSSFNGFPVQQVIHYNFIEGHLLIDGRPLGKLPPAIRESEYVKELFGNQHLLTYPSTMPGMTHVLTTIIGKDHQVHFGLRGDTVVIRAITKDDLLELIPRKEFCKKNSISDLPQPLISDCVHWLNLQSKRLEIRQKPDIWKQRRASNWWVNVQARRGYKPREAELVDPRSTLFQSVQTIFQEFEFPDHLMVTQPKNGRLTVWLKRQGLSFTVNHNNLLECRELRSEIDPDQDAGTWYGFLSKIVLRDIKDLSKRSIITALGQVRQSPYNLLPVVRAEPVQSYGRYVIDHVLGRLTCPPESRLLYNKARFHAFTSFVLPDSLTGRTGREEAQATLQSGICQPWRPISTGGHISMLQELRDQLCPGRQYYPPEMRALQTVKWTKDRLSILHDSYDAIIQAIIDKSNRLSPFYDPEFVDTRDGAELNSHLRRRGEIRQSLYERDASVTRMTNLSSEDCHYVSRDTYTPSGTCLNAFQITKLCHQTRFSLSMGDGLRDILARCKNIIGGFHDPADDQYPSLSGVIETNTSENWGALVNFCRNIGEDDRYKLSLRLALLTLNHKSSLDLIRSLAAFSHIDSLKSLETPKSLCFTEFKPGEKPDLDLLKSLVARDDPAFVMPKKSQPKHQAKARARHREQCESEGKRLAEHFLAQWPNDELRVTDFGSTILFTHDCLDRVRPHWQRLVDNWKLSEFLKKTQSILDQYMGPCNFGEPCVGPNNLLTVCPVSRCDAVPCLARGLLQKPGPCVEAAQLSSAPVQGNSIEEKNVPTGPAAERNKTKSEHCQLRGILNNLQSSPDIIRQEYAQDLKRSLEALTSCPNPDSWVHGDVLNYEDIIQRITSLKHSITEQTCLIRQSIGNGDDRYRWLDIGGLWPCTSRLVMLEQLRSVSGLVYGKNMKESIVQLGVLLTNLQRLYRLKEGHLKSDRRRFMEEQQNKGHTNWNPHKYPDWLLLELDSNIMIREEQVLVAQSIISPRSGENSVLQMNMGKGKTSCIVPMATAVLADKKQLCRLVVPKALLMQTTQIMQSRMGGLLGRELRHMPFSRQTKTGLEMLNLYSQLHRETLAHGGIILALPEHIMSYGLSGPQHALDSKNKEARYMVEFQKWLTETSRDVLDESDFTLAVKTQLIYPSGAQKTVDGHPHRWHVAQALLAFVESHVSDLYKKFPNSFEFAQEGSAFPRLHFLHPNVEEALKQYLVNDICNGRSPVFRLADHIGFESKEKLKRALLDNHVESQHITKAKRAFADRSSGADKILICRGMLQNGILLLCLKKRWNVQYGLHPKRWPIAVPFEAKGVPSEQAEFGHPDVAILFTCLAFYYSGLTLSQFIESVTQVLKSDDPTSEYERWIQECDNLPDELRQWSLINTEDKFQVEQLWRYLRLKRSVLNHYMNHFVFPVHAKQFEVKIQASGWDIPLAPQLLRGAQKQQSARTTGFSGTNDNKSLLPLTIRQDDLPSLSQTNAEVLSYLLEERNRRYQPLSQGGKRMTEKELLGQLKRHKIRVLIDAGAFVLEMQNQALAKAWLDIDDDAEAAVYFGIDNRAWVQYPSGKSIPLLATPFAENMENCLVYIDEAHTRGTDLKLPQNAVGALTLALDQTKDHTVQAAMRLRQLGTTQSVVFYAPPEVNRSIRDVCNLRRNMLINSSHCVKWLLEMTCRANEQLQALYVAQGMDFCRRTNAAWENPNYLTSTKQRQAYLQVIRQKEGQTLKELYGDSNERHSASSGDITNQKLSKFMQILDARGKGVTDLAYRVHSSAFEEVEQEREVEFQVEEVREVQRATHYKALEFPGLHAAIKHFCKTGVLKGVDGYEQAFSALARTALGKQFGVHTTFSNLYVSKEFMRTIKANNRNEVHDVYFRQVEWILWSPSTQTAVIIIPEEADKLLHLLKSAEQPMTHLIPYSSPVTKSMVKFGTLTYYAFPALPSGHQFPAWLPIEVGILAGRLYLGYSEYAPLLEYLQVEETATDDPLAVLSDRTNVTKTEVTQGDKVANGDDTTSVTENTLFTSNPLGFLLEWLSLRRRGQDITHTPMGYVCQRQKLTAEHPFFKAWEATVPQGDGTMAGLQRRRSTEESESESEDEEDVHSEEDDEWDREEDDDNATADGGPVVVDGPDADDDSGGTAGSDEMEMSSEEESYRGGPLFGGGGVARVLHFVKKKG